MGIEEDALGKQESRINSKKKGNKNEVAAAKFMTKWVGTKFARTPSSGGLRWVNASMVCGDITCEDQDYNFPFTVEVKAYKSADLKLKRKNSQVFTFWKQAMEDANRAGKLPMLLVRVNGMPKGEFMVYVKVRDSRYLMDEEETIDMYVGGGLVGYSSKQLLEFIDFNTFVGYQNN